MDTTDKETVLYTFTGVPDGAQPFAGVVRDANGNLYGTTGQGGGAGGFGTVFKVDPAGNETVLHSFSDGADGGGPGASLLLDAQDNLYGTTTSGGDLQTCILYGNNGCGVVFKMDPTGNETVLYNFTGGADGGDPVAGLVRDAQGNLYGTAYEGGANGYGTVFKLTPSTKAPTKTTTTLKSSLNPSIYGQTVTFTASVTPAPPDGETVSFMSGKTVLGTGTLNGGSASFTDSTLKAGTASVTAVYGGDANFSGSKSKALKQVVDKATTKTALVSSLNPSNVGQSVTFTATVTPEYGGTITGKVAFYDGTKLLKSVAVSGGAAKYTTKTLTEGKHSITATYNGSTSFSGSSGSLTQTVN